jgi:hypothetical protein
LVVDGVSDDCWFLSDSSPSTELLAWEGSPLLLAQLVLVLGFAEESAFPELVLSPSFLLPVVAKVGNGLFRIAFSSSIL